MKRDEASRWLSAGLCLSRVGERSNEAVRGAAPWILATLAEEPNLPPAGVIADVGKLLGGATLALAGEAPGADARLKGALRRYEDQVLGRLVADARFDAACDATAKLPEERRAQAVAILVASVMGRIGFQGTPMVPGIARRIAERAVADVVEEGFGALRGDARVLAALAEGYEAIARGAQRARSLVADADVFALENLLVLGSLTQRLAIAQVVEAQEALGDALPRRLTRSRRRGGATPTRLEDESEYPIGGFASVATSGSLENIVTSELVYMDTETDDVDLFDMRYVEGELLYYTRDESIFVRRRRLVVLAFAPDLVEARFKDPGLRWQRIVVILGLALAAVKRLTERLGDEELSFRAVFPKELAAEGDLLKLLLREWVDKGMAEVVEGSLEDAARVATASTRRALVQLVTFGLAAPKVEAERVEVHALEARAMPFEEWCRASIDLLRALL